MIFADRRLGVSAFGVRVLCSPPGFRPGSRVPFGLIQKEPKDQAPNALAPSLRLGVPVPSTKTRAGQKLPAFALLTSVRQSGRARGVARLRRAPLPWRQSRRRKRGRTPTANTEPQAADCRQRADSWVWLLGFAPLRRRVCGKGRGARASALRALARADCLTEVSKANAGSFCPTPAFAANPGTPSHRLGASAVRA